MKQKDTSNFVRLFGKDSVREYVIHVVLFGKYCWGQMRWGWVIMDWMIMDWITVDGMSEDLMSKD